MTTTQLNQLLPASILLSAIVLAPISVVADQKKVRTLPFKLQKTPMYYDKALYLVTDRDSLVKLSTHGQLKWQTDFPIRQVKAIVPRFNTLYVIDQDDHITKLDAIYGYIKGKMYDDKFTNIHLTSAFIYYLNQRGLFRIRSAQSGSLVWGPNEHKFRQIYLLKNLDFLVGIAQKGLFLINPYDQKISPIKKLTHDAKILDGGWDDWILVRQGVDLSRVNVKSNRQEYIRKIGGQRFKIYDGYILAVATQKALKIINLKKNAPLWRRQLSEKSKYRFLAFMPSGILIHNEEQWQLMNPKSGKIIERFPAQGNAKPDFFWATKESAVLQSDNNTFTFLKPIRPKKKVSIEAPIAQ